jgi:hypothetical protein
MAVIAGRIGLDSPGNCNLGEPPVAKLTINRRGQGVSASLFPGSTGHQRFPGRNVFAGGQFDLIGLTCEAKRKTGRAAGLAGFGSMRVG